jgi:tight adherence protein C
MYVFLVLGLICIAVAVIAVINVLGSRRLRTTERLASIHEYGFTREQSSSAPVIGAEPNPNPLQAMVTAVGDFVAARVSGVREDNLREQLMQAGMYNTSPRTLLGYRVFAAVLLPVVAFLLLGTSSPLRILLILVMIPGGWLLPMVLVQRKGRKRLQDIDRRLPDLIDLLCVMVEAGLGFLAACRTAAEQFKPPLGDELRLMLQEQTMGLGLDEALSNMAHRADTPAMRAFVRAMANGERMGISTGQIMRNLSREMRLRRRRMAEERAQKAPIRMLFPLVFLIFPAMFVVLLVPGIITLLNSGI